MKNRNFLNGVLLTSALILTPVTASAFNQTYKVSKNSLTNSISSVLHKRGIDEDAAERISRDFVGEDEYLFAIMILKLEKECSVLSREEIVEYLSIKALRREKIEINSYSFLVNMVYKIKQKPLTQETLKQLSEVVLRNLVYSRDIIA